MAEAIRLIHVVRPSEGGIQTHVVGLASRLPPARFDQIVVGALTREFQIDLARRMVPWAVVPVPGTSSFHGIIQAARQLRRLFANRSPHIVHAHGYLAGVVTAWALRGFPQPPAFVLTAHVLPDPPTGKERAGLLARAGYRWLFRRIDRGIAVSRSIRDAVAPYTRSLDRWLVIHNGVDPKQFHRRVDAGAKRRELGVNPSAAVVGVVARLSHEKGVDVFLHAAAKVARDLPNVDFVIVGDGPARDELEALAHRLQLSGQVVFLGRRRDVRDILAALDILVVPSREESFGLAALEGVVAGVRTVASDVGGLREILGETSSVLFVPPDDPEALAHIISQELTTVEFDSDTEQAEGMEMIGGTLMSLADMLVAETEFNLDEVGLQATPQPHAAARRTERELLLERFDIRHMVRSTIELYEELARGKSVG